MEGARATSPACSRNSSRKSRRSDLAEREYRANSAPLTTSGRLTRAKTGPSRLVTYGASALRSAAVNGSTLVMVSRGSLPAPSGPAGERVRVTGRRGSAPEVRVPAREHVLARWSEDVDDLGV